MSHPSKDGVDKIMLHIQKAVNLRAEAELSSQMQEASGYPDSFPGGGKASGLREESRGALKDAKYMLYALIDVAVERSKNEEGG